MKSLSKEAANITTSLVDALLAAEKEVIVISPYFVPRKSGVDGFVALKGRGVDVTIITNSLAANNQFTVHGGYAPYRRFHAPRPDTESAIGTAVYRGRGVAVIPSRWRGNASASIVSWYPCHTA